MTIEDYACYPVVTEEDLLDEMILRYVELELDLNKE